jgi:hypothetical protein
MPRRPFPCGRRGAAFLSCPRSGRPPSGHGSPGSQWRGPDRAGRDTPDAVGRATAPRAGPVRESAGVRSGARSVTTAPPVRRSPPASADGATRAGRCRGRAATALRRSTGAASEDCIRDRRAALYSAPSPCTRSRRLRRSWRAGWPRPLPHRRDAGPVLRGTPYSRCPIEVGISRAARPTRRRVAPGAASTNDVAQRGSSVFHVEHRSADSLLVSRETPGAAPAGCAPPRVAQRPAGPARRHVEVDVVNPAPHPPSDDVSRETSDSDAHQPPGAAGPTGSRRAEWSLTLRRAHAATQSTNGGRAER